MQIHRPVNTWSKCSHSQTRQLDNWTHTGRKMMRDVGQLLVNQHLSLKTNCSTHLYCTTMQTLNLSYLGDDLLNVLAIIVRQRATENLHQNATLRGKDWRGQRLQTLTRTNLAEAALRLPPKAHTSTCKMVCKSNLRDHSLC